MKVFKSLKDLVSLLSLAVNVSLYNSWARENHGYGKQCM